MITIEYDGCYPNLCSGKLVVIVDEIHWEFPSFCLSSGGFVSFDENWNEEIGTGEWCINDWPGGFPVELREAVLESINSHIEHGCCGGCV